MFPWITRILWSNDGVHYKSYTDLKYINTFHWQVINKGIFYAVLILIRLVSHGWEHGKKLIYNNLINVFGNIPF